MKRFIIPSIIMLCAVFSAHAQDTRQKVTLNVGFLAPNTLNAVIGYERSIGYGNAVEIFGEAGNHWQTPSDRFWNGYYWDGGFVYKHRLKRYRNSLLRLRFGPQFGADRRKFFIGIEGGFEWSYVFQNGCEFAVIQKNNVNFLHGDTFRNGLLIGLKVPL